MEKLIQEKLAEVENQYGVSILLACETGSRAWGFPSPDSDYDVRFIYRHPKEWYLSIDDAKDTIEYLNGDLDLVGWDIRKCLQLLRKSNAAIFERLQSPIIYRQHLDFRQELLDLAPAYFSLRAGLHHYLSMAFNYYKTCAAAEEVKLKSYFYLLRTTLASLWIVENKSIPPLAFRDLLVLVTDEATRQTINRLLLLKARVIEGYFHPQEAALEAYLKTVLEYCETRTNDFPQHRGDTGPLHTLFRNLIETPWA